MFSPSTTWLADKPGRSLSAIAGSGRCTVTLHEFRSVAGVGTGATIEEALAAAMNDAFVRQLENAADEDECDRIDDEERKARGLRGAA